MINWTNARIPIAWQERIASAKSLARIIARNEKRGWDDDKEDVANKGWDDNEKKYLVTKEFLAEVMSIIHLFGKAYVIDELRCEFNKWASEHGDIAQTVYPNHVNIAIDDEAGDEPTRLHQHSDLGSDKVFVTILDNGTPCEFSFHDYLEAGEWMVLIRDTTRDIREVGFGHTKT